MANIPIKLIEPQSVFNCDAHPLYNRCRELEHYAPERIAKARRHIAKAVKQLEKALEEAR